MIAVDTSALMAIAQNEPEAEACLDALHTSDRVLISAVTLTESLIVAAGRQAPEPMAKLRRNYGFTVISVTEARAQAAASAYFRYGKGWHAANLNFADCFAYTIAKEHDCPLLFKGNDFALTDVAPALP